jgi:hypothetical protein
LLSLTAFAVTSLLLALVLYMLSNSDPGAPHHPKLAALTALEASIASAARAGGINISAVSCSRQSLDTSTVPLPSYGWSCVVSLGQPSSPIAQMELSTINVGSTGCWRPEAATLHTSSRAYPGPALRAALKVYLHLSGCIKSAHAGAATTASI